MDLEAYLTLRAADHWLCPLGFSVDNSGGPTVLLHKDSGFKLSATPLQPFGRPTNPILLYWYTNRETFFAICGTSDVKLEITKRISEVKCKCLGSGIRLSSRGPHEIPATEALGAVDSNRALRRITQNGQSSPDEDEADYCIPLFLPRTSVINVCTDGMQVKSIGRNQHRQDLEKQSEDWLLVGLKDATDPPKEETARRALADAAAEGDARTLLIAARLLKSGAPVARLIAVRSLSAVAVRLGHRDPGLSRSVLRALRLEECGDQEEPLCKAMAAVARQCNACVLEDIAVRLGATPQAHADQTSEEVDKPMRALACLLTDEDPLIRQAAVRALADVVPHCEGRAAEAIVARLADKDRAVRESAIWALGAAARHGDKSVAAVVASLEAKAYKANGVLLLAEAAQRGALALEHIRHQEPAADNSIKLSARRTLP